MDKNIAKNLPIPFNSIKFFIKQIKKYLFCLPTWQRFPVYPGLHWQVFGLTQLPFLHLGLQIASWKTVETVKDWIRKFVLNKVRWLINRVFKWPYDKRLSIISISQFVLTLY